MKKIEQLVIPAEAGIQSVNMFLKRKFKTWTPAFAGVTLLLGFGFYAQFALSADRSTYEFNDSHFHLTNYIQEGTDLHDFLKIMGNKTGRVALFGIPLQQEWAYHVLGDKAPTYYLDVDSPLYYYSFTDAVIAHEYLSLSKNDRERFDPMITGFNPADMYAVDHIRRVMKMYPGVFTGIGEFTIHKEFVSSKVAGDSASLTDPALDRVFDFAAESGLVVLIHSDIDRPFAKKGAEPVFLAQMKALFKRHPNTSVIWAHTGLGRVVHPVENHGDMLESIITDPAMAKVNFDISWDEVAKYFTVSDAVMTKAAAFFERYPDRFLFGTDEVAPKSAADYNRVYEIYKPLLAKLTPETREKILKKNYERIFDEGRRQVRIWENVHK